jgi:Uncharacterized conserved protein
MKKKNRYNYIAIFHLADDGVSVSFPDLPRCLTYAADTEEALKNAKEALGLHIWELEQEESDIPEPTQLEKIKLEECDIPVLVEVFMPSIREKVTNQFTKKTLSIPAWLAAKADENNVNCSRILRNALISYLELDNQYNKEDSTSEHSD